MNGSFKRTLSLLLAIVMCFSLLPLTAFAADGQEEAEIALLTEDEQDDGSREEQEPEAVLTDAAETEETPAPEAEEVEIETPEGEDMAPAAEEEVLPARVSFICTPEELALIVFDADGCVMDSEEDGSYLLIPGEYSYTAICEGYQSEENVPFTVESDTEIEVTLDPAKPLLKAAAAPKMALAATASITGRDDGKWLFPLDQSYYNSFSDWAACPGHDVCSFCGYSHDKEGWGDSWHSGQGGHNGIDVAAPANTQVKAAANGKIIAASAMGARGNTIIIEHSTGDGHSYYSYYQHLNSFVKTNGEVSAGTVIGKVGNTPTSAGYGYHLHFGIVYGSSGLGSNCLNTLEAKGWIVGKGGEGRILNNPCRGNLPSSTNGCSKGALEAHPGSVKYVFTANEVSIGNPPAAPILSDFKSNYPDITGEACSPVTFTISNYSSDNYYQFMFYNLREDGVYRSAYEDSWTPPSNGSSIDLLNDTWYKLEISASNDYGESDTTTYFFSVGFNKPDSPASAEASASLVYNNHRYERYDYPMSWTDAKAFCEALGGHLVTIASADENAKICELFTGATAAYYWIGLSDTDFDNNYTWEAGETGSYRNWDVGEPYRSSGNYYAAITGRSSGWGTNNTVGKWIDRANTKNTQSNYYYVDGNMGLICEYDSVDPCYKGHTWNSGTVTKAASCTADGVKTYTCTVCSTTKTEAIAKLGHNYTSRTVAGNCTTPGKTVYTCSRCSDSYEEVNANWSDWSTTKPTGIPEAYIQSRTEYRTQQKETTTSTSNSQSGWTPDGTSTTWGEYGAWSSWGKDVITANDATQVESRTVYGWYCYVCPNCKRHMHGYGSCYTWAGGCGAKTTSSDFTYIYDPTNWNTAKDWYGTGHSYAVINGDNWFAWNDGNHANTEVFTGYRSRTRTQQTVYKFYRWTDWSSWTTTAATASSTQNVETRTTYRYNTLVGEHVSDSGTVTKAAACTTEGVKTYKCTECGETLRTESIAALGHSYDSGKVTKAASCAETGVKTYTCTRSGCGATKTETIEKLTTHTSDNGTVTKAATCTETGTKAYKCTVCKTTIRTETVPALGHTFSGNWSKDGNYHWHAATCGHVNEVKDKAEHSWDDGTVTKAATESETGIKTYSCTVCKQTKTETIPKLAPATAPVISVVGTKGRPGEEITVSVVLKNNPGIGAASFAIEYDHSKLLLTGFEDGGLRGWLVGVGAGEKANWTTTDYLNNNMLNGEILKLKFNILDTAALGETVVSVKEIDVTDVDAEPVEFSGQSGTVNIIRVIPGDVNDDGKVGSGDALLVKKHLAGYEVSLVMEAADVNGDGKVGSADALLIQKYLAGYDVILK